MQATTGFRFPHPDDPPPPVPSAERLPPVADRRAPERRDVDERGPLIEDPAGAARTALAVALAICGGLALVFLFFSAVAEVDPGQALGGTLGASALAGAWVTGHAYRVRNDPETEVRRERERRGF